MRKKILVLAMAFALLSSATVFAQTKLYSLQDVWQSVLKHYPSLEAKKQAVKAQELRRELLKEGFLPDINVQAQQSYGSVQNTPGSFFPLPGMFTTNAGSKTPAGTAAGAHLYSSALVHWDFLQFGREQKKLAVADAAIKVSHTALKQEEWQLLSAVTRLYFAALADRAALGIARADAVRIAELLELVQAQANAGLRPGADTLLLKAALLQSKAKEHDQQAALKSRQVQLAALTGINSSNFAIDTTLFTRFQQTSLGTQEALQNHPYLQVLEARIRQAEAEKEVVKKEVYPSVGLLAGVGVKGSGVDRDGMLNKSFGAPWQNASGTYLAGIGLTWNFSSLYQNKTKRAVADRVIASAKADRDAANIQLNAQYTAALEGWNEQRQKLLASRAALENSREAYGLYEVRYHSGLLSLIELLELQKNLQEAENNYVRAVSAYWTELLSQAESLGDPSLLLTVIQP